MTEAVEMFMMVVCHQPYSELDKIPFAKALRYMQAAASFAGKMFGNAGTTSKRDNKITPTKDPRDYFL